jgi:hypothetical protein
MKNKKYGDEDARKAGKKPAEELDEQAPNMEE